MLLGFDWLSFFWLVIFTVAANLWVFSILVLPLSNKESSLHRSLILQDFGRKKIRQKKISKLMALLIVREMKAAATTIPYT